MRVIDIVTPADEQPISIEDFKLFAGIDFNDQDSLIESLIETATTYVETKVNRKLVNTTVKIKLDGLPVNNGKDYFYTEFDLSGRAGVDNFIQLSHAPVSSIVSFKTYDDNNNESVFNSAYYRLDSSAGRVYLNDNNDWPYDFRQKSNIHIEYICGYGDATEVPEGLKTAIKMFTNLLYENRGACDMNSSSINNLLAPYKFYGNL